MKKELYIHLCNKVTNQAKSCIVSGVTNEVKRGKYNLKIIIR